VRQAAKSLTPRPLPPGEGAKTLHDMRLTNALALARAEQFRRVVRVLPISGTASRVAYHLMQRFYLSHGLLTLG